MWKRQSLPTAIVLLSWVSSSCSLCQNANIPAQQAVSVTNVAGVIGKAKTPSVRLPDALKTPNQDDVLRGGYGPYRANNDLLSYRLKLRVDPARETIQGTNAIRFRMLTEGQRIQLELSPALTIESLTFAGQPLNYTREERTLWVNFPQVLKKDQEYTVIVAYSGHPERQGRFGCFSFDKDKEGKPWITTACEGEGASVWWPNKDQWRDEPQDGMQIDVSVPNGLIDVSNGRFEGSEDLGDGYTEWHWRVHYPINNYDVALNIGEYQHFTAPQHGATTLDYYALPEDLEKAKVQFGQVPTMLDAYEHFFGEYPFDKDGYKLIEVPYAGMEHQSAVAYGNHFENGYYGRDWTGVGISPRFDFIIIHESGHEWFGNAVTAADRSDMWIHEGWTTYMETLYVEYRWGRKDALRYTAGLKPKVHNDRPIIPAHAANAEPPEDQYFKGALMLNTLRSVVGDDAKWFADIHDFYQNFKYQTIMTEDVVRWWNARTGLELTPFFNEYLRHAAVPVLEWRFDPVIKQVSYRWKSEEPEFAMPIQVGDPQHWTEIVPSTKTWAVLPWNGTADTFQVATDLYYVQVERLQQ
ncbi:MAG: M1 family metallopeptidase [Janthinobacterium lividum]